MPLTSQVQFKKEGKVCPGIPIFEEKYQKIP
jgi:hypothetical protein